jgi:hypothetical protein
VEDMKGKRDEPVHITKATRTNNLLEFQLVIRDFIFKGWLKKFKRWEKTEKTLFAKKKYKVASPPP